MIQRIYSKALFLKENESPSIAEKILKIMNIMREGEEFYIEESSGVLAALLVEIARLNRASPEDRVEEETGKLTNMITRVLDFVSYHYMEDIRIEDLAKICHISETHFRRVFTSHMKVSPLGILILCGFILPVNFCRQQIYRWQILRTNVVSRPIQRLTGTSDR